MVSFRHVSTSVAVLGLFAFSSAAALAATEEEITSALESLIESGDAPISVELGTPTSQDDTLVYENVVVTATGEDPSTTTIDSLTITGGDVNEAGGLVAEQILAEGISNASGETTATVRSFEAVNVDVAPAAEGQEPGGRVDAITIEGINVVEPETPPVNIETVSFEASDYRDGYPHAVRLAIEGIEVDPSQAPEGDETAEQLKALGYDTLSLSVLGSGRWDEASGDLVIEELTIEGDEMGALTISGELGGFTADLVAKLDQPNPPPELMEQITISSATVTFEDESLTGRVLDTQASEMGTDRATFVEQITAAMPLMLTMLQNPSFQDEVAGAVTTFLKDPQTITVSVEPSSPVSILSVIGTAQMAPQSLPDMLNVDITANAAE